MQFPTISNPWAYQMKATWYGIFQGIQVIDLIFSVITIKKLAQTLHILIKRKKERKKT